MHICDSAQNMHAIGVSHAPKSVHDIDWEHNWELPIHTGPYVQENKNNHYYRVFNFQ